MAQLIHELLLHVVVVVARVVFCMWVFVMMLGMSGLMVSGLGGFLGFWFCWLGRPPGSDPVSEKPHVSCQHNRIK